MALAPPPPPHRPEQPLIVSFHPGAVLWRIYNPKSKYKPGPTTFRINGPHERFDHQIPNALGPCDNPHRGIYYAADCLEGAVVEVFGDSTRIIERKDFRVVEARLTQEIRLLDLRKSAAMRAGTAVGITGTETRSLTQEWSRYFYGHPLIYQNIDGLLYSNSHNGLDAIAIYERGSQAIETSQQRIQRLAASALQMELLGIAYRNDLTVL